MRSLRRDTTADERLFGPFIFFATFIVISALIISAMGDVFRLNQMASFDYSPNILTINEVDYQLLDPTTGYDVTTAKTVDRYDDAEGDSLLTFTDTVTSRDYDCCVVRNNYFFSGYDIDWWIFESKTESRYLDYVDMRHYWGWWSTRSKGFSFDMILGNQVAGTNLTDIPFMIRDQNYHLLFLTPDDAANHTLNIETNDYKLLMSYPFWDEDLMAKQSLWSLLGKLLTAQLPSVHPVISLFIAVPIWTGIAFMVFTLVSRMIPFISGG